MNIFLPCWLIAISFLNETEQKRQNRTLLLFFAFCTNVIYLLAGGETILQAANVMGGRG